VRAGDLFFEVASKLSIWFEVKEGEEA